MHSIKSIILELNVLGLLLVGCGPMQNKNGPEVDKSFAFYLIYTLYPQGSNLSESVKGRTVFSLVK